MSNATIYWPIEGAEVRLPLVPYGTSEGVNCLFGVLQNQDDGEIIVAKAQQDGSYWDIHFLDPIPLGTYTFYLIGFPGGLLGSVGDIPVIEDLAARIGHFDMHMSQPTPGQGNLPACFTAAGGASPGGTPSGTVTNVNHPTQQWTGTNPVSGSEWSLRFQNIIPSATDKFKLHVDVSNGSGSQDNGGLGITHPC